MARNLSNAAASLLPYSTIEAAASGNVDAINAVLKHYERYIAALATRTLYDENGVPHLCLDEEKVCRMRTKLITKILDFKVNNSLKPIAARAGACPPFHASATGHSCIREERFLSPDRSLSRLIHSQISHAPESADLLYLENFIGNRITNLNGAKPSKWRAMIRTERRIWASDSASLHLCVASQMAMTSVQLTILPR